MMDLIMFVALLAYIVYEDCQRDRRRGFRHSWFKRTVHSAVDARGRLKGRDDQ